MFKSLYSRLSLALVGLFAFVGIALVVVTSFVTEMHQQEVSQQLYHDLAANIAAEKVLIRDESISRQALEEIFHALMIVNPAIEVYLLDPEGVIRAFSGDPGGVKRTHISLEPVRRMLGGDGTPALLGDDPRDAAARKAFSAARIPAQGRLQGYLYIILGGQQYDAAVAELQGGYILRLADRLIGAVLVFGLLAGLAVFSLLTGRLKKLTVAVDSFEHGEQLPGLPLSAAGRRGEGGDEIDRLALTFRSMASRIADQVERLRRSDRMRRELVANVSHDLRSPLATLAASVETLQLKEGVFTPEQRQEYLKNAQKHCARLNTLVTRLFELARLDDEASRPSPEIFPLSELVQDVVQKYELHAREKGVSLITNAGHGLPSVKADLGLIERVLENLLANAIRFTPAGGTVSVVLEQGQSHVLTRVLDTGEGIPPEVLPHIFERFRRPGSEKAPGGSFGGLGLAIAQRIMEMHDGVIEVQSELHSGSCFSFRLPIASPHDPSRPDSPVTEA